MLGEPLVVVARIARALDTLGVRYVVGGSVASSIYGTPRSTQDVDVVAELAEEHVEPFVNDLRAEFYVDADMIRDAIVRRGSFNVIHLASMFKADVFVPSRDSFSRSEMARGRIERVSVAGDFAAIRFASPEDTLLHKLIWYRLGGEVSDRQWQDVIGILRIQGKGLDRAYLDTWADALARRDRVAYPRAERSVMRSAERREPSVDHFERGLRSFMIEPSWFRVSRVPPLVQ
jgi:hypothetical protein